MARSAPDMSLLDGLADPIFLMDHEGRLAYLNRACESAFAVKAEVVRGRALSEVPELEVDPELLTLLKPARDGAIPAFLAAVRIGGRLWDVRVTPAAGSLTAVYCIPSTGFQPSRPDWAADSADAIWAVDHDDRIVAWNPGAEELLGYTAGEIVGQPVTRLIPPDLIREREPERLRAALQELRAVRDYQTRRLTKDGHELEVSLTRTLARERNGEIASWTIARDLTQWRQVERQVIESEKLVTLGQLAASVAQEIGAPLTTIGLSVESLQARCQHEGPEVKKQLDTISQQVSRIARLTRGLVELAKPGELKMSHVSVSEVIGGALELLEPSLRRGNIRVEVKNQPEQPKISADPGQLQQVFINLLMNAQRALAVNGGGRIRVKTEVRRGLPAVGRPLRSELRIELSDDGPGIDPADVPYIFAPFFSRFGGSGLGLALTKQIIHAHGGTIEAISAPGEGAAFIIHLPVEADA